MLVRLFKGTQPIVYIVLPLLVISIWTAALFFNFEVINLQIAPLYDLLVNNIFNANRYLFYVLTIILILFQSFYIAHVVDKHELLEKRGYLAALIYMVMIFIVPHSLVFHPIIIVNTFYILILDKLFNLYKSPNQLSESFDIGLLCAISTLFYLPSVFMLLFFIISINIIRSFSWRNIASSLLGYFAIIFLVWLVYFLFDKTHHLNLLMGSVGVSTGQDFTTTNFIHYAIIFGFIILVIAIASTDMILKYNRNTSRLRRFSQLIWIYCLIALIATGISFNGMAYQLTVLSIPFTLILCHLLSHLKKRRLDEIIFFILLLLALDQFLI